MLQVAIKNTKARRWNIFRRRAFSFSVAEKWSEVPQRRKWVARVLQQHLAARDAYLRSLIPFWYRLGMTDTDWAALRLRTEWMELRSQCAELPIDQYQHRGVTYIGPIADGGNIACGEFAVADQFYQAAVDGDVQAQQLIAAILYREADSDQDAAARRGDMRVPFFHQAEAEARIARQRAVPEEVVACALLYLSGLKAWVNKVYGPYIFEQPNTDDDDNPIPPDDTGGPEFGWWGILQATAEAGTFGTLREVYQSGLHEVCIFLVRKKTEHDRIIEAARSAGRPNTTTDDDA